MIMKQIDVKEVNRDMWGIYKTIPYNCRAKLIKTYVEGHTIIHDGMYLYKALYV